MRRYMVSGISKELMTSYCNPRPMPEIGDFMEEIMV